MCTAIFATNRARGISRLQWMVLSVVECHAADARIERSEEIGCAQDLDVVAIEHISVAWHFVAIDTGT